jgi:alpha-tubulin suppressor-like RCC1 family protein
MAIRGDGRLFAWGINANGVLGTGDNITRSSPVQIGTNSWRPISAGISHTAGITSGGTNSVS